MFSTIFTSIFAVGFICTVSGLETEQKDAYKAIVKCAQYSLQRDEDDLRAKGGHFSTKEKLDESCISLAQYGRCLLSFVDVSPPVPDGILFYLADAWQHMVFSEKAGICQNLPSGKLKEIVLQSGILERKDWVNIEEDDYEECAGDVFRKCTIDGYSRFEESADENMMIAMKKYYSCFEKEAKAFACDAKMLQHFIAYRKACEQHFEEGKEKFGKMVKEMSMPHMEL